MPSCKLTTEFGIPIDSGFCEILSHAWLFQAETKPFSEGIRSQKDYLELSESSDLEQFGHGIAAKASRSP